MTDLDNSVKDAELEELEQKCKDLKALQVAKKKSTKTGRQASTTFAAAMTTVVKTASDFILSRLISSANIPEIRIYFEAAKNILYSNLPVSHEVFKELGKHRKLLHDLAGRSKTIFSKRKELSKNPIVIRILTHQIDQKFNLSQPSSEEDEIQSVISQPRKRAVRKRKHASTSPLLEELLAKKSNNASDEQK